MKSISKSLTSINIRYCLLFSTNIPNKFEELETNNFRHQNMSDLIAIFSKTINNNQ